MHVFRRLEWHLACHAWCGGIHSHVMIEIKGQACLGVFEMSSDATSSSWWLGTTELVKRSSSTALRTVSQEGAVWA